MADDLQLLTEQEVADILRISTRTLRQMRASGDIRYVQVGRKAHYRRQDVAEYIDGNSRQEVPAASPRSRKRAASRAVGKIIPFSQRNLKRS